MKIAIVIGHTKKSPGAFSPHLKTHEYDWNTDLAISIQCLSRDVGIFRRDFHGVPGAYAQAQAWGADKVIELHFNAAGEGATGTETLYVTDISKPLALAVQKEMVSVLEMRDRGAKLPWQDRGRASLTALPGVPSIIVEPFFGSNAADCARASERKSDLARAILRGADNA